MLLRPKVFSIFTGATYGEHILSFVVLLRRDFLYVETYSTIQILVFDSTDSNILRVYICFHLLLIVN